MATPEIWSNLSGPGTNEGRPAKLGIQNAAADKFPLVAISGLTGFGGSNLGIDKNAGGNPSFSDSLLWVRSRHSIRIGGEYQRLASILWQPGATGGSF